MVDKNKIVILFGANGMLGRYIKSFLNSSFNVICIYRHDYDVLQDSFSNIFNSKLSSLIENIHENYDLHFNDIIVVNAIGLIPHTGNRNISDYFKINTQFPHALDKLASEFNFKYIHITTDCVFNGYSIEPYNESSFKDELNVYGVSKSLGDYLNNASTIRTSIIGEQSPQCTYKSLLEWVRSNENQSVQGYNNHYWNGLTCLKVSQIIHMMIYKNIYWNGVRHFYSQSVSKYTLIKTINHVYDLNININIVNCKEMINKTLNSIYNTNDNFNILLNSTDNLYDLILEQKNYKLIE
jgi:dTDP-4-dehydrorhamnose reductase